MSSDNFVFFVSTGKINNFKKLADVLKEIFNECPMTINKKSVSITETKSSTNHNEYFNALNCVMDHNNFDTFICNVDEITIHFKTKQFQKMLKSINNNCSIALYVLKSAPYKLNIEALSKDKVETERIVLTLLTNEDYKKPVIKDIQSGLRFSLACSKLVEITKKFNNTRSDYLFIESSPDVIKFSCKPQDIDAESREFLIRLAQISDYPKQKHLKFKFSLKFVHFFMKGVDISDNIHNEVELYISYDKTKSDNFVKLVISYKIGNLGDIKLATEGEFDE